MGVLWPIVVLRRRSISTIHIQPFTLMIVQSFLDVGTACYDTKPKEYLSVFESAALTDSTAGSLLGWSLFGIPEAELSIGLGQVWISTMREKLKSTLPAKKRSKPPKSSIALSQKHHRKSYLQQVQPWEYLTRTLSG